jgi:cytochrome o ubiquinol oxidase subunit 3
MNHLNTHNETTARTVFGFWVYLMTDCVLFATLFATYAVLHTGTYGGPSARELFSLPLVLAQTLILLTSSFTCGLIMLATHQQNKARVLAWSSVTFLLGLAFLMMELTEFVHFVYEGNSWARSAFLSSYFTLVSTHGLHITAGLVWIVVMVAQIATRGFTPITFRRLSCFSLFWHFLDVIWIFIFTIVYLMGVR